MRPYVVFDGQKHRPISSSHWPEHAADITKTCSRAPSNAERLTGLGSDMEKPQLRL